jgi:hypothetical protein
MCRGCWDYEGEFPAAWSPPIARAVVLWRRLYDELGEPTGGPLHVYLDDYNLDLDVIEPHYYEPRLGPNGDEPYAADVPAVCDELAALLNAMTLPERYTVMAYADAFHKAPGAPGLTDSEVREETYPTVGFPNVKVTHLPSDISLLGCGRNSEEKNREMAWRMLANRLAAEAKASEATAK